MAPGSHRRLGIGLCLILLCYGTYRGIRYRLDLAESQFKRQVTSLDSRFPMVVVTDEDGRASAYVIAAGVLKDFRKAHPRYSFLMPKGQEAALTKNLTRWRPEDERAWWATSGTRETQDLTVSAIDERRQSIVLRTRTLPGRNAAEPDAWVDNSWYEASAEEVVPRFREHYSPDRFHAGNAFIAAGFTFVLWTVGGLGYLVVRKTVLR